MTEKTFPFYCEWCGKIKEGRVHEPDVDSSELTWEEIIEKFSQFPTSHYICAECVRKIIGSGTDA